MLSPAVLTRAAAALLGSDKGRKALGWTVVAICSPLLVLIAFLCSVASGMAQHNAQVVSMCFSDGVIPGSVPAEYRVSILKVRSAFEKIDDAVADITENIEDPGAVLDTRRIKAVFLSLYFGQDTPGKREIRDFVDRFVVYEQRTRTVTVEVSVEDDGTAGGDTDDGAEDSGTESENDTDTNASGAKDSSPGSNHAGTGSHAGSSAQSAGSSSSNSNSAADDTPSPPPTQTVTVTQQYTAAVPIQDMAVVYANIGDFLGEPLTAQQQANAERIYSLVCNGYAVGSGFAGADTVFIGADGFCSPIGANWRGVVSSGFGDRDDPFTGQADGHTGIDLTVPSGTPIRAALSGTVVAAQYNAGGYGYYVKIDHGNGLITLYGHCSQLTVSAGQIIAAGEVIALSGSTGRSTGPHLHFEVRVNGEYVDPEEYLP